MEPSEIEQNVNKIKELLKSEDFDVINTGLELLQELDATEVYEKLLEGCGVNAEGRLVNEKKEISDYLVCTLSSISNGKKAKEIITGIANNHIEIKLHSHHKIKEQLDKLLSISNIHVHLQNFEDYKSLILKGSEPISEEKFTTSKDFIEAFKSEFKKSKYFYVQIKIGSYGYITLENGVGTKWGKDYELEAMSYYDHVEINYTGNLENLLILLTTLDIDGIGGEDYNGNNVGTLLYEIIDKSWIDVEEIGDIKWFSDSIETELSDEEENDVSFNELYLDCYDYDERKNYIERGGLRYIKLFFDNKSITYETPS